MKFFKKSSLVAISIILCFTVLCQTATAAFWGDKTLYVKDLKIIYADSEKEAKEQLPDGYNLLPDNINDGTGELGVYICYSTTDNPDEAITDIKVMHESGGFQRTDFKSSLDEAIDGVYGLAQEMTTAINEFLQNYNDGVPAAVFAKEALDYFQYDDTTLLGDFMISGKGTYKDYGKMILMCHEEILNPILSLLALGVQNKSGENWIDKLADVDPTAYDSSQDMKYRERATKLRPILQQFNDIYCYVVGYYDITYTYDDLTDENDKELFTQMAENEDLFRVIQTILQSYPVGTNVGSEWADWGATAEDMFALGLNETLNMYESYALLDCLTPGQEIMLRLTGPYNFIIGSQNTAEVLEEARKRIVENLDTNEKIPIWDGINLEVLEQEVGLTSDAQRSIAAGKQYDIFAKDIDTLSQKYRDIAAVVSSAFTIASCSVLVTKCALVLAPRIFSFFGGYAVASAISAFASSAIVTTVLSVLGITFTVVTIVCALFITFFLEDIISWMVAEKYDRTTIPMYMVDEVINKEGISTYTYYRRVDNVKTDEQLDLDTDDNESGSDINVNEGYRWMALYTTDKSSAGNPIEANFSVVSGNGLEQDGYVVLGMFGSTAAVNLNSYADKNSSKYPSIYLHYVQDKVTPVESEKIYISNIRVESGIHEDEVKKKLSDSGYLAINQDFGCKKGEVTFIGYKLTGNKNDAIRDIRLLYNFNGSGVTFGDLKYGSMGTIGNFSLMVSATNTNPAPPVVAIEVFAKDDIPDASLGYEPVNEFSGGMAQKLGRNDFRLYFLPETTYTTGPDYLAGIKTDVYYYNTHSSVAGYRGYNKWYYFPEDMFGNNTDAYRQYKTQNYGEQFFDFKSETNFYFQARDKDDSQNTFSLGYKYNTTKNPYRAIYGLSATKRNGLDRFDDSITYAGEGFVLAAAELSYNSYFYSDGKFVYAAEANTNEFGDSSNYYYQYIGAYRPYYSSKNSPGKADATLINPELKQWEGFHARETVFNQDITQAFFNDEMNALYLSGYQSDRTPLTTSDIIITKQTLEESEVPSNFTAVYSMIGDSAEPTNVAPSNDEALAGKYSDGKKVYVTLYDKVYMYFRNEKTVNKKTVAQSSLKEGKYISGLFISSREEIRENYLKNNKNGQEILCKNINKAVVENNLFGEGATNTYKIHINTNFSKKDSFTNANYTYVGITRSDDEDEAIRDIKLYVAKKGEYPNKEIKLPITYNGTTFDVTYTLVSRASLTEQGNKSSEACDLERQVYVYASKHPALGAPITEIKMADMFSYEDFEPVLTTDNKHFITAYNENKKADGATIFVDSDYFLYGNQLSFKREGADKPYIQSINLAYGGDSLEAATKLLEAGYTDIVKKDLNEDAGGKYVYLGMTRTADKNDAIHALYLTNDQKKPEQTLYQFTLVSDLDLNYKAGGKYIYLYSTKRPDIVNTSPILDIKTGDETFQGYMEQRDGNVLYREDAVTNQNAVAQDVNESAGGDYIYLIACRELKSNMMYIGSMLSSGSIAVIGLFLVAAAGAIIYVKLKKKRETQNVNEA